MRYGLELPCGGDDVPADLLVELGVEAERAGWDGVFLEDYLEYYRGENPSTSDPWLVLALVAGRTQKVTLGTTVTGLLARDPVGLARGAMTLQALSGGRVVLGVGAGDPGERGAALNPLWDTTRARGPQVDERLDLLLGRLSGRVPVWVGGSTEAGAVARRAARVDGVVPYKLADTGRWSDHTTEDVLRLREAVARHRREAGRADAPLDVAIGGRRRLSSMEAERAAVDAAARGGATWWLEFVHPGPAEEMLAAVRRGPVRATGRGPG
ncbi:LLM class flavin-dependent oxidoreductase [Phycicoccus sp. MAQZ13P-2]|uniref:LLM class flavin-dependent oxidoreductase n=1 Tax=Phycicoccus mangrovi TaxID=2840470 RepID=UPI001BFFD9A7|nr:LLM class flavin-dependent oxidoreductase [Phycicoccus mangrovi]MBT9254293.1 LLM class flavin-dependent oxidoreductase [Phycicoccus mangrovi]MBT9272671.1 LLM class flavin-dependent oxidoreductase [Phycicoccus mangrovi]